MMADQHNNYDMLENSFQSSAPVTFFVVFNFGCNFMSLGVNGEEGDSAFEIRFCFPNQTHFVTDIIGLNYPAPTMTSYANTPML